MRASAMGGRERKELPRAAVQRDHRERPAFRCEPVVSDQPPVGRHGWPDADVVGQPDRAPPFSGMRHSSIGADWITPR